MRINPVFCWCEELVEVDHSAASFVYTAWSQISAIRLFGRTSGIENHYWLRDDPGPRKGKKPVVRRPRHHEVERDSQGELVSVASYLIFPVCERAGRSFLVSFLRCWPVAKRFLARFFLLQ